MLINGLIERLSAMKLYGMAQALEDIHTTDKGADLDFEDRLTLMIDHEEAARANRALKRRLQVARLRFVAGYDKPRDSGCGARFSGVVADSAARSCS
jgi:hypothetical protein